MSKEVIALPVTITALAADAALAAGVVAILLTGGTVVLAGSAAVGVSRLISQDLERARREGRRERAVFAARLHDQQQVRVQAAAAQRAEAVERAAAREVLDRLGELTMGSPAERSSGPAESHDFLAEDRRKLDQYERSVLALAKVEQTLDALPQELLDNARAPFGRLANMVRTHRKQITANSRSIADTAALRMTAERTINAWIERQEQFTVTRERLRGEAEALLDEVFECRRLAVNEDDRREANQLLSSLVDAIEQDRAQAAVLNANRRRLSAIRERGAAQMQRVALRTWVAGQVGEHLAEMGYTAIEPFTLAAANAPATGLWRLPDGGRVRVALQGDGRIEAKLDGESEAEEDKWCADVRKLLRRLAADGMPYVISFERRLPAMPIVALDTADEILDGEEEDFEEEDLRMIARAHEAGRRSE